MSTVKIKTEEQIKKELKAKNPDWSDQTLKIQVGRQLKAQETALEKQTKHDAVAKQVRQEHVLFVFPMLSLAPLIGDQLES